MIKEVCNSNTGLYNKELNRKGDKILVQMCLQLASLKQDSSINKWTKRVMHKFTRASITSPFEQKYYTVSKTLKPILINAGDSNLYSCAQKGFLALVDGNHNFSKGRIKRLVPTVYLSTLNTMIMYYHFQVLYSYKPLSIHQRRSHFQHSDVPPCHQFGMSFDNLESITQQTTLELTAATLHNYSCLIPT